MHLELEGTWRYQQVAGEGFVVGFKVVEQRKTGGNPSPYRSTLLQAESGVVIQVAFGLPSAAVLCVLI